ncbi:MAG: peptidase [Chlorobiaceae bacterium]|nr:peptidase [Chlorobiaceae bacterium]MBA4309803.1 peptidase [Chlorobiaceae bacterium]
MSFKKAPKHTKLKPMHLRWTCNPKIFDFKSTKEIEPIEGILGQDRALRALRLGVNLKSPGYNIYISGLSGTGKASTVKQILESISEEQPNLLDYAYVNNFNDDSSPLLLTFPAGKAKKFKLELQNLIAFLKERIPQTLDSENVQKKRQILVQEMSNMEKSLVEDFEKRIIHDGFTLGQIKVGELVRPEILPIVDGKPVAIYELENLAKTGKISEEIAKEFIAKYSKYQIEMMEIFKKGLKLSQDIKDKIIELEKSEVEVIVYGAIFNLKENFPDENVIKYLTQVEQNILENLIIFRGQKPIGETTQEGFVIDYFRDYDVNIILDNSNTTKTPVIVEINPTYTNLFGAIEKVSDGKGGWYADFTQIKAGSILKANGGFLVLNVNHLFEEPGVWKTLKRILTFRKLEINEAYNFLLQFSPTTLKPESINVDTKVILIGSSYAYSVLSGYEDDFKKIFKVKAEFDFELKRTKEVMINYARVIKKMINEENLFDIDNTAIAYLFELSSRYAGEKEKLTARFSVIADLVREANYWAKEEAASKVSVRHIIKAYNFTKDRHGLYEEKMSEMIQQGTILIDTHDERVGEINGLAVYGYDFFAFGKPSKITAAVAIGAGNIINVEREAGFSGKSHDKGILIIAGFFRETFGQNFPLSFSANIAFEQSYGVIDGDSASAAEIFALLSALSKISIKQGLAVTGSINQKGEVQPIGGVNEKIEGFFDVCKMKGLKGGEGVIIPKQNIKDIMLREDIIDAVKNKTFSIYAIEKIEEGIEILTGIKAGKRKENGFYEERTIYGEVESRLKEFYQKGKNPFKEKENEKKNNSNDKNSNQIEKSENKTDNNKSKRKKK